MADMARLERALINADKAGDAEGARKLAAALKAERAKAAQAAKPKLAASGTMLRGALKGAASLLELPGQAYAGYSGLVNSGLAAGARAIGLDRVADTFADGARLSTQAATLAPIGSVIDAGFNSVTRPGSDMVETAGNVAGSTVFGVGLGRRLVQSGLDRVRAAGTELAASPRSQLASGAAATGAGQLASAAGAGPVGSAAAALLAGGTVGTAGAGIGAAQERGFAVAPRESAARIMQQAALDPASAAAAIRSAPAPVSGARTSAVEASLDPGLAGLARAMQTAPEIGARMGVQRQQSALARSSMLDNLGGPGNVLAVEDAGRAEAARLAAAQRAAIEGIGPVVEPEAAGDAYRAALQERFGAARSRASALYDDLPFRDEEIQLRPQDEGFLRGERLPQPVDGDRVAFQREGMAAAAGNTRGVAAAAGVPGSAPREPDPVARGVVAWIRSKGGIRAARGNGARSDFVGDLQARGITSTTAPGLYGNRGQQFDYLLTSAKAEGLLPPNATSDDLADMIERAYFGKPQQSWAGYEGATETARSRMTQWDQLFSETEFEPSRAKDEEWDAFYRRVTGTPEPDGVTIPTPGKLAGEYQNSLSAIVRRYYPEGLEQAPTQVRALASRLLTADVATPTELRAMARRAYDLGAMMGSDRVAAASAKAMAKATQAFLRANAAPAYVSGLRKADAAYRQFARTYRGGEAGRVLGDDRFGVPRLEDARVPSAVVQRGDTGASAIQRSQEAAGPDATRTLARARLRQEAETRGASRVESDYAQALRAMPDVQADVVRAREAEALAAAFPQTPLGRMYADPERAIAALAGRNDGGRGLRQLVGQLSGNPDAIAGLRRGIVDHVMQRSLSREVVQTGGQLDQLAQTGKMMDGLREMLRKTQGTPLFTAQERGQLNRLLDEVKRAQFAITANRTSGSDTARNATVIARFFKEGGITGQDVAAFVPGRTGRVAADVTAMGINALRRAGAVRSLVADAMLDPKLAAELLEQPTPDAMSRIEARLAGSALGTVSGAQDAYSPANR